MDLITSRFMYINTPDGNREFHHYYQYENGAVRDCGMCLNTCDKRAAYSSHWTTDNEYEKVVITPNSQCLLDKITEHNINVFELCTSTSTSSYCEFRAENGTDTFVLTAVKYRLPELLRLLFTQANHISVKIGFYVKDAKKDQQEFLFTSSELCIMHHYDIDDSIDMIYNNLMEHVETNISLSDITINRIRLHVRRIGSVNEGDIPLPLKFRLKKACFEPTVETDPNNDEILATLRNMSAKNLGAEKPNAPGGQQSQHTVAATASTAATTTTTTSTTNDISAVPTADTTTDNTSATATTVATAATVATSNKRSRLDVSDSMFSANEGDIPMPLQFRVKKACVDPTVEMQLNYDEILATLRNMSAKNLGAKNPKTPGGQQSQHTATATASTAATTTTTNNISATPTAATNADTTTDNTSATATTAATGARSNDDEPMCIKTVVVTKDSSEMRVSGHTFTCTEHICQSLLVLEADAKRRKIDIASASYLEPKSVDQSVRNQLRVNLYVLKICRQTRELFCAPYYFYNTHCQQTPSFVILTDVLGRVRRLAPIADLQRFLECDPENTFFTCHCGSDYAKRKTLALCQMLHCGQNNTAIKVRPERLKKNSRYSLLMKWENEVLYGLKN